MGDSKTNIPATAESKAQTPVNPDLKANIVGHPEDPELLRPVDFSDPALQKQLIFSRYWGRQAKWFGAVMAKKRKGSNRVGIGCGVLAFSIYVFTLYKVRQESFLDDFEEPPRESL